MHKFGVFIGRFQPFHNAHLETVRFALSKAKSLIIVLGSDSGARTIKNPWSTQERIDMIRASCTKDENSRIKFISAKDYLYNDNLWITTVQEKVEALTEGDPDVVLIGHQKDRSSFYLSQFPQWKLLETGSIDPEISATSIRQRYFQCNTLSIAGHVPEPVLDYLKLTMTNNGYSCTSDFLALKAEYEHIENYKEKWQSVPYPPTFVTTDAIVIKSGHVLVVRRKSPPGKGLIALPGGFLQRNERIIDGCLRELKEETKIKLPKIELKSKLVDEKVFDHPDRSLRGRTITHAFCINLGHGPLPQVVGSDDADKAWWMPLRDVATREDEFFEDHFHIITYFTYKF